MRPEIGDHLPKSGAAGLFSRLHVDILFRDRETVRSRVLLQQLQLRRDREALFLLLLRGDAGVDYSLLTSGILRQGGFEGLRHFWYPVQVRVSKTRAGATNPPISDVG